MKQGKCHETGVTGNYGRDSPHLAAEMLMAHVLGWERARVIGHDRDLLDDGHGESFRALVRRHAAGEPLHYLTGEREFYGLPFRVSPQVLIPRPETEILVERAATLARARGGDARFADVGTGSGCIAVSVARELPEARGWATDISQQALALARENARRLQVHERIEFLCCSFLEAFSAQPQFDFILCNPPYVAGADLASLPRTVREHEPLQALCGGETGFEAYLQLIPQAALRLAPGGCLLLEIGAGQAREVANIIGNAGLILTETLHDLQSIPRCLVARRMGL
jgi:release factor glutamine methyltransferase